MTVAVPHWMRSPDNNSVRRSSHRPDYDDMTYSEPQFSVGVTDMDKDGNKGSSHLPWRRVIAAGAAAETAVGGSAVSAVADEEEEEEEDNGGFLEEFVDMRRLSTAGADELPPPLGLHDSFFNMPLPAQGSMSLASALDDLDNLLSCGELTPPSVVAGATEASTPFDSCHFLAVGLPSLQSSWPLDGVQMSQQRTDRTYTYSGTPAAAGGGSKSISDSELLRLEGISLKASPSHAPSVVSHPPTPLLQALSATSSNINLDLANSSNSNNTNNYNHNHNHNNNNNTDNHNNNNNNNNSGRKPSNFFKAVASKLQQKAASVRHKQPTMSSTTGESRGPLSPTVSPRKDFKLRPDCLGNLGGPPQCSRPAYPISPPNSATIRQELPSTSSVGSNPMSFCEGFIEDPFATAGDVHPDSIFRRSGPATPLDTPIIDDKSGIFYNHQQMSSGNVANTSKATWPIPPTTPQIDPHTAWSNSYDSIATQWWPTDSMDMTTNSEYHAQNERNADLNMVLHTQHSELPYEYNNFGVTGQGASGLMIHMPPQPHATSSPVAHYQPPQLHHDHHHNHHQQHQHQHQHQQHQQQQQQQQQMTERRPRMPRAPSAGARHMGLSTPMRKTRNASRPHPGSRESSCSPTPTNRSRHSSGGSMSSMGGGAALSASVKKRRSWNRRESMRTPSIGSGLGGASDGIGFVNFTPSDKNILMTGVAPSGSSKTKARREKEAMEKRRRLSEVAIKAVKDAGGDVDKLVGEFAF